MQSNFEQLFELQFSGLYSSSVKPSVPALLLGAWQTEQAAKPANILFLCHPLCTPNDFISAFVIYSIHGVSKNKRNIHLFHFCSSSVWKQNSPIFLEAGWTNLQSLRIRAFCLSIVCRSNRKKMKQTIYFKCQYSQWTTWPRFLWKHFSIYDAILNKSQ